MTKVFKTPFGALGDKQEVPVPTQTDGSVSYEQGFGIDYNRDYEDPQAKDIEREKLNQLFYDLTQAVGELQQLGYMKWQAGEYQAGSRVELAGTVYKSRQITTSKPPSSDWIIVNEQEVPVDQIFYFESPTPPAGYIARNGQAINPETMPKLYARYGANMPDDRNRVHRMQGDLTGSVGSAQEDAAVKVTGRFGGAVDGDVASIFSKASGALQLNFESKTGSILSSTLQPAGTRYSEVMFDNGLATRTATETRVKSRIVIFCNKIQ